MGRNYRAHAAEMGNEVPKEPLLFLKPSSSLVASGDPIVLPPYSTHVEFEGEIGLLLGARLRHASPDECRAAVSAIVPVNDVTARDLQKNDGQWTRAKGSDTFCPVGTPVPVGELPEGLEGLVVRTFLNGDLRQEGRATEMVFAIPDLLAYASTIMTLEPGDLISTGTPHGVAPITPGDVVRVEIEGVGSVENPVVAG